MRGVSPCGDVPRGRSSFSPARKKWYLYENPSADFIIQPYMKRGEEERDRGEEEWRAGTEREPGSERGAGGRERAPDGNTQLLNRLMAAG